ncbi:MAG: hypothetical protein ACPGO3_13660 [Magnetospiraceae bacterium]
MYPWHERLESWIGTAADLAAVVTDVLRELGLEDDTVVPNERLVRNYVQYNILERPARKGKEAYFGFRQIVEFLVARQLVRDGWPLAKIGEFTRTATVPQLFGLLPQPVKPNLAKALVEKFEQDSKGTGKAETAAPSEATMLARAAQMTTIRTARQETVAALGTADTALEGAKVTRFTLSPWCQVYVELDPLMTSPPETAELLGKALTQALALARLRPGEKK